MLRYQLLAVAIPAFVAYRVGTHLLAFVVPHVLAAVATAIVLGVFVTWLGRYLARTGKIERGTSAFMIWVGLICVTAPAAFEVSTFISDVLALPQLAQNLLTLAAVGAVGWGLWHAITRAYGRVQ